MQRKYDLESASSSDVSEQSEYYSGVLSRQERAFFKCCSNCFKAGRPADLHDSYDEGRHSIMHAVTSSDELHKPSSVVLTRSKEAWRTTAESAWLMIHFGGLCEIWGVVISWWCNSFADYVKINAAVDQEGEYWNQITGADTHVFPTFDRVTRIDFRRVPTTQIRLDLRGGHRDFLRKQYLFGIRQVEVIGRRSDVMEPLWQETEKELVEKGLRKIHRQGDVDKKKEVDEQGPPKKLYMPGEALKEAQEICKGRVIPPWSLVMESGILEQVRVWPGTRERSRMQIPNKCRWTKQDPAHPFYWMSPRERVKQNHMQQKMLEEFIVDDTSTVPGDDIWEEWDNDSNSGWSPSSTRPSSAQPGMRRPSTPLKYSASRASTRPTTADSSRAGTRPGTPARSGRPSSSSAYAVRFGGRPSTSGNGRPSTAPSKRPGSAPQMRVTVIEE